MLQQDTAAAMMSATSPVPQHNKTGISFCKQSSISSTESKSPPRTNKIAGISKPTRKVNLMLQGCK